MTHLKVGRLFLAAVTLGGLLCSGAASQTAGKPAPRLADIAWLEGNWHGRTTGGSNFVFDETWSAPRGGVMHGMFRLTDPANADRVLVLEYATLRETAEGVEMRIRHFDTALTPWEKGDAIVMKFISADGTRYEFENFVHNSPKRTVIVRDGDHAFSSRAEIIRDDGTVTLIQVEAERVKAPPAASK